MSDVNMVPRCELDGLFGQLENTVFMDGDDRMCVLHGVHVILNESLSELFVEDDTPEESALRRFAEHYIFGKRAMVNVLTSELADIALNGSSEGMNHCMKLLIEAKRAISGGNNAEETEDEHTL